MSAAFASVVLVGNTQRAVDTVLNAMSPGATLLSSGRALFSHFLRFEPRGAESVGVNVYALRLEEYTRSPFGFSDALSQAAGSATDIILAVEIPAGGAPAAAPGANSVDTRGESEPAECMGVPVPLLQVLEGMKEIDSHLIVVLVQGGEEPAGEDPADVPADSLVEGRREACEGQDAHSLGMLGKELSDLVARLQPESVMQYDPSPDFSSRLRHFIGL